MAPDGGSNNLNEEIDTTGVPLSRKWLSKRAIEDASAAKIDQKIRNCETRLSVLRRILADAATQGVKIPDGFTAGVFLFFSILLLPLSFVLNDYSLKVLPVSDGMRHLITLGVIATPVLLFEAIDRSRAGKNKSGDPLVLSFAITAFCVFLGVVVLFAAIRGRLFSVEMEAAGVQVPAVMLELKHLLRYALPGLSVVLVLADSVMFRAAIADLRHPASLAQREIGRLSRVLEQLAADRARFARLRAESAIQGTRRVMDGDRDRCNGLWRAVSLTFPLVVMLSLVALVLFGISGCSFGEATEVSADVSKVPTTVFILDESGSINTLPFQRNVQAIESALALAEPGRRYLVLPVVANSWRAEALLDETMPARTDSGIAFGAQEARIKLVRKWHELSAAIRPGAKQTDLLGALAVAAEEGGLDVPGSRIVVYSDGLNTVGLTIIGGRESEIGELVRQACAASPWVLSGAPVHFINAGRGPDPSSLARRRDFWVLFLEAQHAGKVTFSATAQAVVANASR